MSRRHLAAQPDLDAHLEWLRYAVHDSHVDVRLVLEGILDVLEALVTKGPPR